MTSGRMPRQGPCHASPCGAKSKICNWLYYNKMCGRSPVFFVGQCLQRAGLANESVTFGAAHGKPTAAKAVSNTTDRL
jgi:hypothetical protein